ncbi:hypothetical protein Hanom_Chr14g01310841 [Helianthus anomalus]
MKWVNRKITIVICMCMIKIFQMLPSVRLCFPSKQHQDNDPRFLSLACLKSSTPVRP